jgi:methionine-rich copper-binding protein CopC
MLRKHALTISFVITWAVALGATAHAGIVPQHAPVLGAAPIANSNAKTAPTVAAVLIGDADLGGPNDFLFSYDQSGVNHAGTISTSPVGDATKLEVPLSSMKNGWYASHWNVQSADGHMAGGDDGLWWAFGVKGVTRATATKKVTLSTPTPVASLPNKITASVNGLRVGTRTISVALKTGTITSFKWQRLNETPTTLIGASFPWAVSFQKITKKFVSTGVIPFPGSYKLTAQITLTRNGESHTALWSSVVAVNP